MASTIVSWGLTITLIGAAVYIYRPDLLTASPREQESRDPVAEPTNKSANKKPKPKKATVPKLVGAEKSDSANESQSSKKRKIISAPVDKTVTASTVDGKQQQLPRTEEDGLSDKDFAKQLADAQAGTRLQVPQKQQQQQQQQQPSKKDRRTTKLTAASSPDPSGFSTEASSTTGRDADDDLTPAESPESRPIDQPISRAGDVSDMLEPPTAKPTTLRLTDVSNESKPKKPVNKAFEPVLSKKKRNEKQRKEEQRLAREESDRIHEAKKQEQLRKARMAAGTSNQTKANNFAAQANAWQSGTPTAVKNAPSTNAEPFLDTFEPVASTASTAHGAVHTAPMGQNSAMELKASAGENAAAALTASSNREGLSDAKRREYSSDLSEEDQIKILQQQQEEDAWESVTNKKSKRKGKHDNESTSGASSPVRQANIPVKPQVSEVVNNSKKAETVNRFQTFQAKTDGGLQDAEWEA